jgi:hypothetical protein
MTSRLVTRIALPAVLVIAVIGWIAMSTDGTVAAEGGDNLQRLAAVANDACKLLTVDELSKGLGSSYAGATSSRNGEDEISCEYSPGPGNMYPATLTVTLKNGKTTMAALQGVGTKLVPGTKAQKDVGDASFYMPLDVGIYALKGDLLISLQFGLGKGTRQQKQALVQKILSQL